MTHQTPTLAPRRAGVPNSTIRRRLLLGIAATVAGYPMVHSVAQTARISGEPVRLAQLSDSSQDQQEISRDYATGVRVAVNDYNRASRRRVKLVTHRALTTKEFCAR